MRDWSESAFGVVCAIFDTSIYTSIHVVRSHRCHFGGVCAFEENADFDLCKLKAAREKNTTFRYNNMRGGAFHSHDEFKWQL